MLGLVFLSSFDSIPVKEFKITKVVIDAGHGGVDPGALGHRAREKDITLAIALKVGKYIEENCKGVKVIYTRTRDVSVNIYKRPEIANENKADLFISIHCNSSTTPGVQGSETFVMGLHKSAASLEVAKKENEAILLEEDYTQHYDGFNPNSPEANIIFSLFQNAYLSQSLNLATKIQKQFKDHVGRLDRGVKQAGFLVLYKVAMPSILVETGFISNPKEEVFLMSQEGQEYMASAIYRAFKEYKKEYESNNVLATSGQTQEQADQNSDRINVENPTTSTDRNKIVFRVQFASSLQDKPLNAPEFKGLSGVYKYYQNNF